MPMSNKFAHKLTSAKNASQKTTVITIGIELTGSACRRLGKQQAEYWECEWRMPAASNNGSVRHVDMKPYFTRLLPKWRTLITTDTASRRHFRKSSCQGRLFLKWRIFSVLLNDSVRHLVKQHCTFGWQLPMFFPKLFIFVLFKTKTHIVFCSHTHILRQHRATITLFIIVGAFTACWLPYFTCFTVNPLDAIQIHPVVEEVFLWMGYSNSCINPFVYGKGFSINLLVT